MDERRGSSAQQPAAQPPQWLTATATGRIQDGMLPRSHQSKVIAGPGRGQFCVLCDHAIEMGDVCYQVHAAGDDSARPLHFHVPCYRAWQAACQAMPRVWVSRGESSAGASDGN